MRTALTKILGTAALLLPLTFAQASLQNPPQSVFNSHELHPDHTVTFRYKDSDANEVRLTLEGSPHSLPMHRGDGGIWSVTTTPLAPELYRYSFQVEGKSHPDPANPRIISGFTAQSSMLDVPGATPEPWEPSDVPHGVLHRHVYTTKIVLGLTGNQSNYLVYTPPGYDAQHKARHPYPVLYLLHGWSDRADGWTATGQANLIFDNLIAAHKIKPMVVVMPFGYGDMAFAHNGHQVWDDPAKVAHNVSLFRQALLTEVLPQVEQEYNVSRKREDRAIAGLSMGGLEALTTGLTDPNLFAWVGGMSSAFHSNFYTQEFNMLNPKQENLKLLWVSCGTEDKLRDPNRRFVAFLESKEMPVTQVETPGLHTWLVWRDNLIHFAPLLFQNQKR
jgi:enterochelin esterase-like enzyme